MGIPALPLMPGNPCCVFVGERGAAVAAQRRLCSCQAWLASGAFSVLEGLPFPLEPAEATAPSPQPTLVHGRPPAWGAV